MGGGIGDIEVGDGTGERRAGESGKRVGWG